MNEKEINVFFVSSLSYLKYTYVAIYSLFLSNSDYKINVYIASLDAAEKDLKKVKLIDLAEEFGNKIILLPVERSRWKEQLKKYNVEELFSKYFANVYFGKDFGAFLVYLAFDLMPQNVDRVMLLHGDIIVRRSLAKLYFEDMDGICITSTSGGANWSKETLHRVNKCLAKAKCTKHVSAVFAVCNLIEIRKEGINADLLLSSIRDDLTPEDDPYILYSSWNYNWTKAFPDDKIRYCDLFEYSYESTEVRINRAKPKYRKMSRILHYDSDEPWDGTTPWHPLNSIWWAYAIATPFYEEFRTTYNEQYNEFMRKKGLYKWLKYRIKEKLERAEDKGIMEDLIMLRKKCR